jgi:hypothetical protein
MIQSLVTAEGKPTSEVESKDIAAHLDTFTIVIKSLDGVTKEQLLTMMDTLNIKYIHHDEKKRISR